MKLTWWASIGIHATFRGHPHQHANMHHPQQQLDNSYFNIDLLETPKNKKPSTRNEQHMVKLSILTLYCHAQTREDLEHVWCSMNPIVPDFSFAPISLYSIIKPFDAFEISCI